MFENACAGAIGNDQDDIPRHVGAAAPLSIHLSSQSARDLEIHPIWGALSARKSNLVEFSEERVSSTPVLCGAGQERNSVFLCSRKHTIKMVAGFGLNRGSCTVPFTLHEQIQLERRSDLLLINLSFCVHSCQVRGYYSLAELNQAKKRVMPAGSVRHVSRTILKTDPHTTRSLSY